ncbi:MAG TPA: hypothetical protein VGP88_04800 [Thermoplasmata archaeon]|nr:hypothetical protein [Thermoplasmata archaeon]
MSARSASELAPADLATASCRHVRVPGTARTFEVRDQLRGFGLRWDPATHAWHGTIRAGEEIVLERELRVRAQVVHPIEAFATEAAPAPPEGPKPPELRPRAAGSSRGPSRDGSRTRAEARRAYREGAEDEGEEAPIPSRFTIWATMSGLPDDSREADERAAERRLRHLRGRVKAARAALSAVPGAAGAVRVDRRREAGFLARFGITQSQLRYGVPMALDFTAEAPTDRAQPGGNVDEPRDQMGAA